MLKLFIIIYIILAAIKAWMYMYQRTALNVCRSENIPRRLKTTMIPFWQALLVIPVTILKGVLLVIIWIYSSWYIPLIIFISDFIITYGLIPIPHSFFLDKMEKRFKDPRTYLTSNGHKEENEELKRWFLFAVKNTRKKYNI